MQINDDEVFQLPYLLDQSKSLIYVPLRSTVLLVENEVADCLMSTADSDIKQALIAHIQTRELIDINHISTSISNSVPDLSISLTNDCNLACIYCHAHAGENRPQNTTLSRIDQILEYFFNNLSAKYPKAKYVRLGFLGGGEPTIRPNLLKHAIKQAKAMADALGVKPIIATATNGCFNKKMAEYIAQEFSHISLSFDGPAWLQNCHRPFKNGAGSFEHVLANAKYFQTVGLSFAIRATISTLSLERYKEVIDFFTQEFPGITLGFEPLYALGRGTESSFAPSPELFAEGMHDILNYVKGTGLIIKNAGLSKHETLKPYYCNSIAAPNLNVSPNGQIWACPRESDAGLFNYGHFDFTNGQVVLDPKKLKKIKNLNVFNYPECTNCACKFHCAGGCPDNHHAGLLKCASVIETFTTSLNDFYNEGLAA
jgi:uncharacterized protein